MYLGIDLAKIGARDVYITKVLDSGRKTANQFQAECM